MDTKGRVFLVVCIVVGFVGGVLWGWVYVNMVLDEWFFKMFFTKVIIMFVLYYSLVFDIKCLLNKLIN